MTDMRIGNQWLRSNTKYLGKRKKLWFIAFCSFRIYFIFELFRKWFFSSVVAERHSSLGSVQDLRTGGRWYDPLARPIFLPRFDDSHCDKNHSSFTAVHCFDNGYVVKQPVAWKEY